MPEKSGIALCETTLAGAGVAGCPTAGLTATADIASMSKWLFTFMAISPSWLPSLRDVVPCVGNFSLSQLRDGRTGVLTGPVAGGCLKTGPATPPETQERKRLIPMRRAGHRS